MSRRRVLRGGAAAAPATTEANPKPPAGRASMRVEMEGDPDAVREKMGMNNGDKDTKGKESGDNDAVFLEALQKAEYRFQIKRILPREWQGRDARLVVMEDACPMLYQDIVDEVTTTSGGKKFRATVFDPANGKAIAAKTFSIEADPKLPVAREEGTSLEDMLEEEAEPTDAQRMQNTFNNQIKMAEQQLTLERTQEMLDSLRRKKDTGKSSSADEERIRMLEKRLDEEKHQRDLDRQKAESDRKYDELRAQLAEIKANQGNRGNGEKSEVAQVLERMASMQEESNKRFERFLEKSREDKVDAILKHLTTQSSGGGLGTLKEQIATVKAIRDAFDGTGGGDDDDEGEDKEWWEKLIDHVPKILEKLGDMSKGGKKVTKEDFLKEIDEAADRATKEEIKKLETQHPPPRRALPAPAPEAAPAPAPENPKGSVGRPITVQRVDSLPPAAPTAAPAAAPAPAAPEAAPAPAPAAAPQAQVQNLPNAQQAAEAETVQTACGVIVMIELEFETRKRLYHWNYEGAWQNCPEPLLEKLCTAQDVYAMLEALVFQGIPTEMVQKIDGIKTKAAASPRALRWLSLGHKELQRWWQKLEEDPDFDPADEEEEGEEEEQEPQA